MKTLLLVDDTPANLGVLLDVLQGAGYELLVAPNGERALRQMQLARPNLILLDVMMPDIDGFETCRRLKAEPAWRDIPVIFMTALTDVVDKVKGFEAGAVDYVSKPFSPEEVLARVRAHLQVRDLQQALSEQNGQLREAMRLRAQAEHQLRQSLDRAVLVATRDGGVAFCSRLAARLLAGYFAHEDGTRLPEPLRAWLATRPAGESQREFPLAGGALRVRVFSEPGATDSVMLLLEEAPVPPSPARLLRLGLTAREAEVLYWMAHGKTNPEIGVILDSAPNTAKKHAQNILVKLGVETRTAAARIALETLGEA